MNDTNEASVITDHKFKPRRDKLSESVRYPFWSLCERCGLARSAHREAEPDPE